MRQRAAGVRDGRRWCRAVGLVVAGVVGTIACGTPPSPSPAAPTTPLPHAAPSQASAPAQPQTTSTTDATTTGQALVTTPCVLHAGGGQASRQVQRQGDASVSTSRMSCWFGAECIATPGQARPGDGFVGVRCEDAACRCTWSSATSDERVEDTFTLPEAAADSGICRRLLVERCLQGMSLYGGPDGGP